MCGPSYDTQGGFGSISGQSPLTQNTSKPSATKVISQAPVSAASASAGSPFAQIGNRPTGTTLASTNSQSGAPVRILK